MGLRGVFAVRLWPEANKFPQDYVVLDYNDFLELLKLAERPSFSEALKAAARGPYDKPTCPNQGQMCNCTGACLPRQTPGFSDVDRTWHDGRWGG